MRPDDGWKAGDIVQIVDESHDWHPCLLIVTEDKDWGMMGCTLIPGPVGEKPGQAYLRLKDAQIELVGRARYVPC